MKYQKSWWDKYGWFIAILLFAVFVFAWAFGESAKNQKKAKTEREKELEDLKNRRKTLLDSVNKDKSRKRFLDIIFKIFFVFARIGVVLIGLIITYSANLYYDKPDLGDYLTWLSAATICLSSIVFIFFGIPMEIRATLSQIKPRLQSLIYGHEIELKDGIISKENDLKIIDDKISIIEKARESNN